MQGVAVHPMISLVQQRLVGDRVIRGNDLGRRAPRFMADVRMGAAHHLGERVLAAIDYDFPDTARARAQGSHATLLFTDRRVFGSIKSSNINETTLDLSLAAVTSVAEEGGLLNNAAVAGTPQGNVRFPLWGKVIAPYLRAVATLPPEHRTLGPWAIAPGPGDPIGAHAATSLLMSGHPVVMAMPRLAFEAGRRGLLSEEVARRVLERAVILDRTVTSGRGMHQGQWLSTLPRPMLAGLMGALLGAPLASGGDATWEVHDFGVTPGGRSAGTAAASSAIGLASAAIFGVGWVSRPGGGLGFSVLRATIVDFPCGAGMQLAAVQGQAAFRVPFAASGLLDAIFTTLTRIELRELLAELSMKDVPPQQLAAVPRQALESAVAALGVPLDLGPLYPTALTSTPPVDSVEQRDAISSLGALRSVQPGREDLAGHVVGQRAIRQAQDVRVVPHPRARRRPRVAAQRRTHAGDLVRRDRDPRPRPAQEHALVAAPLGHGERRFFGRGRPRDGLSHLERPEAHDLVTAPLELGDDARVNRVWLVGADGDLHGKASTDENLPRSSYAREPGNLFEGPYERQREHEPHGGPAGLSTRRCPSGWRAGRRHAGPLPRR